MDISIPVDGRLVWSRESFLPGYETAKPIPGSNAAAAYPDQLLFCPFIKVLINNRLCF
jgi:hypothetical protein